VSQLHCRTKNVTLALGLFLIGMLGLSCLSTTFFKQQDRTLAQQYIPTIKHRNLVIDLGNGVKTNAQLTFPAVGTGPFPGVLLIPGGGAADMNYSGGYTHIDKETGSMIYPPTAFFQIAEYLSERGFAVLQYDKRGIGTNHTLLDSNVWGNVTFNDLKQDSEKGLSVLLQQPEVNAVKKATLIGHSEGTVVATRIAIDNPDKVANIVLMGAIALNIIKDNFYFANVFLPILYAQNVVDKNHTGLLSVREASKDPVFMSFVNYTGNIPSILNPKNNTNEDSAYISINNELKPALDRQFEEYIEELNANQSLSPIFHKKCDPGSFCPIWARSHLILPTNLGVIGNVSSNIGILILEGEYDAVQQAFLLQQRLTEINHPDHLLITYPNLGHGLYPTDQWQSTQPEPIPQYVLADLYSWLEAHSGLSHSFIIPTTGNMTSISTDTGSNSSFSENQ
jgi:uncharacterized protein